MTADKDHLLIDKVEHGLEKAGMVEHVAVHDRSGWHYGRFTRIGADPAALLIIALVWIWRSRSPTIISTSSNGVGLPPPTSLTNG
jgi:hypothetical protein